MEFPNPIKVSHDLAPYYIDLKECVDYTETGNYGPIDNNMIPMVWYKQYNIAIYNPSTIAQYALGLFDYYLTAVKKQGEVSSILEKFLMQADWFVSNQVILDMNREISVWYYYINYQPYKLLSPWYSALAQGQAISTLLRAYQLTGKQIYMITATRAFNSFLYSIEEGGIACRTKEGHFWLEEYPSNPPSYVLNGFIWALFGIYDYYIILKDEIALKLWEEGLYTLDRQLELYDCGYWCLYDQYYASLINEHYLERIYIPQMKALYRITDRMLFYQYAIRWEHYLNSRVCRLRKNLMVNCYGRLKYYLKKLTKLVTRCVE